MDRIKGAGHVNNRFVKEDVASGRPPTEITDDWLNSMQEEVCSVIANAGIALNGADNTQLLQSIILIAAYQATQKINALVGAAPAALDTIYEIAARLGNDQTALDSLIATIAQRLPLGGGTMTGPITQSANTIIAGNAGGVARGYLYNDAAGIGFLNNTGSWAAWVPLNSADWYAAGNVTAYSDVRVKSNIVKIDHALDKVKSLGGYIYDRTDINLRQTGVIAQEVQKVLPEAVTINPENGHLAVAYGNMVGLLIEAIKELSDKVDALEGR